MRILAILSVVWWISGPIYGQTPFGHEDKNFGQGRFGVTTGVSDTTIETLPSVAAYWLADDLGDSDISFDLSTWANRVSGGPSLSNAGPTPANWNYDAVDTKFNNEPSVLVTYQSGAQLSSNIDVSSGGSVFIAIHNRSKQGREVVFAGTGDTSDNFGIIIGTQSNYNGTGYAGASRKRLTSDILDDQTYLIEWNDSDGDGDFDKVYVDGVDQALTGSLDLTLAGSVIQMLASSNALSGYAAGVDMGAIILCNASPAQWERDFIEAELMTKYGL